MPDLTQVHIPLDEKVFLRTPVVEDAEELYQKICENRSHISTYLLWAEKTTSSHYTKSFLESCLKDTRQGEHLPLCIIKGGEIIGYLGAKIDIWNLNGEIGYWLARSFTKQGLMTKAVGVLVDYIFKNKILHRIEILCAESNIASQRIPQKLGFHLDGKLRDRALTKNGFEDSIVYSLINK
jgi:ribosomal-protein-serine acetyltransferase